LRFAGPVLQGFRARPQTSTRIAVLEQGTRRSFRVVADLGGFCPEFLCQDEQLPRHIEISTHLSKPNAGRGLTEKIFGVKHRGTPHSDRSTLAAAGGSDEPRN